MIKKIENFAKSRDYSRKVHDLIPGGAHTYSKGDDQFPVNALLQLPMARVLMFGMWMVMSLLIVVWD